MVVDGVEYPVDCLVFASGFEVTTDYDHRLGFDPVGRGGVAHERAWSEGAHTLHGVLSGDFPNLMMISLVQAGFGTNFVHFLAESAEHVRLAHRHAASEQGIATIEATPEAEEEWLDVLYGAAAGAADYSAICTPGYYNSEQGATTPRRPATSSTPAASSTTPGTSSAGGRADGLPGTRVVADRRNHLSHVPTTPRVTRRWQGGRTGWRAGPGCSAAASRDSRSSARRTAASNPRRPTSPGARR